MKIKDFKLERYFSIHEFTAKYLLSSSDCDGYPLKYVLDIASKQELELWENMQLGYTESEGHSLLREAVLQYYTLTDIRNVIVASPGELNFITMNVLLSRTDHVIAISPSYQSLYEVVKTVDCELSFWRPNPENWHFDIEDLESLIQDNTKLIIINFPHNPTGSYLSKEDLLRIVDLAKANNSYLFSDEMYHKLVHRNREELQPIANIYEKGISLWGTSKTFGLAGLRTGWLVSQDSEFLKKVLAFKDYLSICNSAPSEVLSIIALNHIDHFLQPNLKKIRNNVELFQEFVNSHSIFKNFIPPHAGSTSFVQLNIEQTALEFSDQLVKDTSIMTVPAEMFEYDGKFIRVGFGRRVFPKILEKLSDYLNN